MSGSQTAKERLQRYIRKTLPILSIVLVGVAPLSVAGALSITLTTPHGGEIASTTIPIAWTTDNPSGDDFLVYLDYSTDGSTWNPITTGLTSTTNAFTWDTSALNSTTTLVRATASSTSNTDIANATSGSVFTIDTSPPQFTSLTPNGETFVNHDTIGVSFVLNETASTSCSIDSSIFSPCVSVVKFSELAQGPHTVQIQATDAAGNTTTVSRHLVLDDTVTDPGLTSGPSNGSTVGSSTVVFTFAASDPAVKFRYQLDTAPFSPTVSPLILSGLSDGGHTVLFEATDENGHVTKISRFFMVSTVLPVLTLVHITSGNASSSLAKTGDVVTLSFLGNKRLATPTVTIGTSTAFLGNGPQFWIATSTLPAGTPDGPIPFSIQFSDTGGIPGFTTSTTTDNSAVTFDGTPPSVMLSSSSTNPTSLSFIPFIAAFSEPVFGFDAQNHFADFITLVNGAITNGSTDGTTFRFDVVPTLAGDVRVGIHAGGVHDAAGNPNLAAPDISLTYVSPLQIDSGPDNGASIGTTSIAFTFSAPELASSTCSLDLGAFGTCTATSSETISGLSEGDHTLIVRGFDAGNNMLGAIGRAFTVRTTGTITAVLSKSPADASGTFLFTSRAFSPQTVSLSADGGSEKSGEIPPGEYSVSPGVPPGWNPTGKSCSDGSSPSSINLVPNTDITCTFSFSQINSGGGTIVSGGGGGGGGGGVGSGVVNALIPSVPPAPVPVTAANPAPPSTSGGQVLGASAFNFTRKLKRGMKGDDVTELQNLLIGEGSMEGPATGYFGPLTEAAVKKYQKAHGLEQVGYVGPLTRAALNAEEVSHADNAGTTDNTAKIAALTAQAQQLMTLIATLKAGQH